MLRLPEGVREGEVFAGKYRIEGVIGAGAMGIVVAAHHLLLQKKVAIKFLRLERLERGDAIARFLEEARAADRIESKHVVHISDIDVLDNGPPYIVMERLEGRDLACWLREEGPMRVEQAVDFVLEACEALAEAHDRGIVHRDLKPANLFAHRQGEDEIIKVLDFGISKRLPLVSETLDLAAPDSGPTQSKMVLGSPIYMSPEQMESARDVDARTDVWALGVILFELVTAKLPFAGASLVQIYRNIVSPRAPSWLQPLAGFPAGFDAVIAKCLEVDRNRRYSQVGQLADALAPFGSSRAATLASAIARSPAPPEVPAMPPLARTMISSDAEGVAPSLSAPPAMMIDEARPSRFPKEARWWRSRRLALRSALAMAVAGVAAGAIFAALMPREAERRAPTALSREADRALAPLESPGTWPTYLSNDVPSVAPGAFGAAPAEPPVEPLAAPAAPKEPRPRPSARTTNRSDAVKTTPGAPSAHVAPSDSASSAQSNDSPRPSEPAAPPAASSRFDVEEMLRRQK